ncbi:hypothetical protein BDY21DRAFT_383766 [Lineolata rhizophorae]|uniref:Tetratricopeptide repeat domain-containing protein n=1 Tax=Lineolata rhizophorae TaxID=578093 RepID=A0A6A6PAS2_9PEZI|nr:hypothetical protein BDY21DRAFT_383766 [Lineolata rhizophorae]
MVFKTLHLARQSLAKTFTHGYAQSVVAASQSSYASQNNSFGTLSHFSSRFSKVGSQNQAQYGFQSSANQSGAAGTAKNDHSRLDLTEYYNAWQKHKLGKDEWRQFQFAKRIEWKPSTAVPDEKAGKEENGVVAKEGNAEEAPSRPAAERSYSDSKIVDFKRAVGDDAEAQAIAQGIEKSKGDVQEAVETVESAAEDAATVATADRTSPVGASVFSESLDRGRTSTPATSISESDAYADQLIKLADGQQYAEIPAVFEAMLRSGVRPNTSAYNALLAAAINLPRAKHQVVPKVLDVYSDMLRRRVRPDAATFSILVELLSVRALDVLAMRKELQEKLLRYGGMEEAGKFMFRSNETEYDILAEDDSVSTAIKLFDTSVSMKANAFEEQTYKIVISACAEHDRVADMVRLYAHMETQNVTPSGDVFVAMIQSFARAGDLRSAVECYEEYKVLAMDNDAGKNTMIRKDDEVYASLVKAYNICGRTEGGDRFVSKLDSEFQGTEHLGVVQSAVALKSRLPLWLKEGKFEEAFTYATDKLSGQAQNAALEMICIQAADQNKVNAATSTFESLAENIDKSEVAMAMSAMHIRHGNLEAAEPFWKILELASTRPQFIEPTAMHTVALIGSGHAEMGLRQARSMFGRIRDSQSGSKHAKMEVVEQIDEAIEVVGHFMSKRGIMLSPTASMELIWTMIENGGLVTSVAGHLLAGFGPDGIVQLGWEDLCLLIQVQAGMILNNSVMDIANAARFGHLVEIVTSSGMMADKQTSTLIEKALLKLDRPDLVHRWNAYKYPPVVEPPAFSPVTPYPAYAHASPVPAAPAYDDSYDPYTATTDNKGSVAITDLLEKTSGKSSTHLNEALVKFKNMRRAGRHPRFFTYAKLISAAAKENRFELAQDILNLAKQDVPFLPQCRIVRYGWNTILDAMVAASLTTGHRQLAHRFHQDLLDMGGAPSANTFGLYITTLKESTKTFDEATEAVKIFLRAKSEGVEPSSFLYNALIGKLGKARRIDDCLFYFAEMRNLGIRPTSVTYGTIVNALCRVSDEKFAEELFEEMESMPNYKPRPAPYHSLMQFFLTTKRDRAKVLAYYERMRARGIAPTTHTYKLLIDTHATLEPVDMAAAEKVLDDIKVSGQRPEAVHFASLIHAKGCVAHDMNGARALFDKVLAEGLARPQACLYQALCESLVANHAVADTTPVVADMRRRGVDLTPYIANSLIHGWASVARDIVRAREIYDSVPVERREPSTYEAMTRAFMAAGEKDEAMKVVEEGLSRGYPVAVANKILELVQGGKAAEAGVAAPPKA